MNNNAGGTVSVVEIKAYPKLSKSLKEETLNQLKSFSEKLDPKPLRYFIILSTATGYIKDVKLDKDIEFDTNPILNEYLSEKEKKTITPRLLNSIYSAWLRELSFGLRKRLTEPEKKLQKFGFVGQIKNTFPLMEYSHK